MRTQLYFAFLLMTACTVNGDTELQIRPLHPYEESGVFSDKKDSAKTKFYYLEGYRGYMKDSSLIDDFVIKHIDSNYKIYAQYHMCFYEKSILLNEKYRSPQPGREDYIRYQQPILTFNWSKGVFSAAVDMKGFESGKYYNKKGSQIFNSPVSVDVFIPKDSPNDVILESVKDCIP